MRANNVLCLCNRIIVHYFVMVLFCHGDMVLLCHIVVLLHYCVIVSLL